MRAFMIVCLTLICASPALAQSGRETRQFRDWTATCPRYEPCEASVGAKATAPDADPLATRLIISRGSYETYWQVSLASSLRLPSESPTIQFQVDADSISFGGQQETAAFGALNRFYVLGDKAQNLLNQLVFGETAKFTWQNEAGSDVSGTLSLSGLAAALLWIDEKQERIGSERVAGVAPEGLKMITTRAPALPSDRLIAARDASLSCDPMGDLVTKDDMWSFRIDADTTLHMYPCWAAAYNFGHQIYIEEHDGEARLQYFADYSESSGWTGTDTLTNVWFDDVDQTLSSFHKGRGLGDCGNYGLWQWNGYSFNLLQYAAKEECDGTAPEDFPIVYQSPGYTPTPYDEE